MILSKERRLWPIFAIRSSLASSCHGAWPWHSTRKCLMVFPLLGHGPGLQKQLVHLSKSDLPILFR